MWPPVKEHTNTQHITSQYILGCKTIKREVMDNGSA